MTTHEEIARPSVDEPSRGGVSRRTVTRTAAWSVPVVAAATAAPAWAASPCTIRSAPTSTGNGSAANNVASYTRNSSTSATWTTGKPANVNNASFTRATITVTEGRSTSNGNVNVQYGFANNEDQNLTIYNTGTVTGPTINQRPTTRTSPRGRPNRTSTTFAFDRTVYNLTFTISDVSKSATPAVVTQESQLTAVSFWDAVQVDSPSAFTIMDMGTAVSGAGTEASPFIAAINATNDDVNAESDVTINFPDGVKTLTIHYWSAIKNNITVVPNGQTGGQGITISNMTMELAPSVCP